MIVENPCLSCGAEVGAGNPRAEHCGHCPPWVCDGCGQTTDMSNPCPCWVSLDGMALADVKGLLAGIGLSVDTPEREERP